MPLAPDVRRKDKEMLLPERIPKFYISEDMVSKVSKRFPNVKIMKHNGKFYVDIREFNSVSWLRLEREKPTRQMYAYTILKFCQFKDSFPDDLIEDYKVDESKVIADLKSFFVFLTKSGYSGNYMHYIMTSLVTWLNVNGIDVSREKLRRKHRLKLPPRGLIMDAPPTREELRRILISSLLNWRSFFSFLSASGVRPSEALVLRIGDLNPHPFDVFDEEEIIEVNIPYTVTKKEYGYVTLIHPECVSLLADYLKVLEAKGIDVEDLDLLLFYNPLSKNGFYKINSAEKAWNRVLKRLNLDEKINYSNRKILLRRLYTLRKFFRTNLEAVGVPYSAVEAMLGHKNWYVRFTKSQLKKFYIKGMWALMVLRTNIDEDKVKQMLKRI